MMERFGLDDRLYTKPLIKLTIQKGEELPDEK
jgi:hypothetical protein